ncbi:MAG: TonB-dependent receptor [Acidobacteria bacterium]|nr:TonB-dependent receptor [Acidobacteriota bacterium]
MKFFSIFLFSLVAFAQSDRGTISGTVSDPAGALIPNANVTVVNQATGVKLALATTQTGNFSAPYLNAGLYEVTVEVQGFRKSVQKNIRVQVAQSASLDITLQIGSAAESISVTAESPLLNTDSAASSTTINREQLNQLPLNFAIGQGAIRNPLSFTQLTPGASINGWNNIKVNGAPAGTFKIIFEGQDSTSSLDGRVSDESQPSVEAVEEFTLQTSNYSAEFGQVGGGLFNFTSRSGTNQYHSSVYDYFVNEAFNAGIPFTNNGSNGLVRPRARRNNFGGTFGGPLTIPKLYKGENKTFFFLNYEKYLNKEGKFDGYGTVPTDAYRNGDFSAALTGRNLGTDGLGRPILENTIYDPRTSRAAADGRIYRDLFPGNIVPTSLLDPVALKIQALIPKASSAGLINNFERRYNFRKIQDIPSVKIDHNFTGSTRVSLYYSLQRTDKDNGQEGLPDPISARRDQVIRAHTTRINFDTSLRPALLLHLGVGYQRYRNPDSAPEVITSYDAAGQLGLKGGFLAGFPRITSLGGAQGGLGFDIGPTNRTLYLQDKPTAVASATWIKGTHAYKFGGEWKMDNFTNRSTGNVAGSYAFAAGQTSMPALQGVALQGGNVGFNYASFLLGFANTASVSNPQDPQYRRPTYGFFVQDTWRLTRKLTLDYGIRYDYQPASDELHQRTSMFDPTAKNPAAGNLLGGIRYAGNGNGRCNCSISNTYPFAFGPRIGMAYHFAPKWVARAGFAVSYAQVANFAYIGGGNSLGMGFNTINFSNPAFAEPGVTLRNGLSYNVNELTFASYDPGIRPSLGQINSPPALVDPNSGRPPRMANWNLSLQREFGSSLVAEVAYVGNRGAWFRADGLNDYNGLTSTRLKSFGLDIANAADRSLLISRIDAPAVTARGFRKPYDSFAGSNTLAQSLRPYPQFGGLGSLWAPIGNTWYDSLQIKVTKRYSKGLTGTMAYTWSKNLTNVENQSGGIVPTNDVYNRPNQKAFSVNDQPQVLVLGFNYDSPRWNKNWATKAFLSSWTLGGIMRYSSGFPIQAPNSNNALGSLLFRGTRMNRVNSEPLYLQNLNNGQSIDPFKQLTLNPKAWSDAAPGEWGYAAAYYNDYRFARRPDEQLSFGRMFRVKERYVISFRAEFFNVLNRTYLNNPDSGNPAATTQINSAGVVTAGFGRINPASVANPPRNGQVVARFQF